MFNKSQLQAINHKDGPALILAGPGSGKTTVIIQRVKNLIEKHNVRPEEILVVTFTKAAAEEMHNRFASLINNEIANNMKNIAVNFGTFHSIFYRILKIANNYMENNIINDRQRYEYLREIMIRLKVETNDVSNFLHCVSSEISKVKGNKINTSEYLPMVCSKEVFGAIFCEYQKVISCDDKIDFDDIVALCLQVLNKNKDVLEMWQERYKYILIDEFQDINFMQYENMKLLALPENNFFIVGDDDQSIYGFRGSKPDIMFQFEKEFPHIEKITLDVNYRSSPEIVEKSLNLISNNIKRFNKKIVAANVSGPEPDFRQFRNQFEELKYVSKKIGEYISIGVSAEQIAVLIRNNSQRAAINNILQDSQIDVKQNGNYGSIYDSTVAKDVIAYLKASRFDKSLPINQSDDLIYILNKPARYISRQVINEQHVNFEKLKIVYNHSFEVLKNINELEFHLQMLRKMSPHAALMYIRNGIRYEKYLKTLAKEKNISFKKSIEIYEDLQMEAERFFTVDEWLEYIEGLKYKSLAVNEYDRGVNIVTMHGSKGLEYQVVFIIDANQGIIPTNRAIRDNETEEERRVFYVAMTRAKKYLHVLSVKEYNGLIN